MELIKKQIHMNQWKGNVTTQITLDDDFIVPDTLDDMEQVMLDTGEIQIETVKNQGDKVAGFVHPDGHFEDVQLIRTPQELAAFRTRYGIPPETVIEKIY